MTERYGNGKNSIYQSFLYFLQLVLFLRPSDYGKTYSVSNKTLFCFQSMHLTEEPK